MNNHADSGLELTLIDGGKINVFPSGLITAQETEYRFGFDKTEQNSLESDLKNYFNENNKTEIYASISPYIHIDKLYVYSYAERKLGTIPKKIKEFHFDLPVVSAPVTIMRLPSSEGSFNFSALGGGIFTGSSVSGSGKTDTEKIIVQESYESITSARKEMRECDESAKSAFEKASNEFGNQKKEIAENILKAGKEYIDLICTILNSSNERNLIQRHFYDSYKEKEARIQRAIQEFKDNNRPLYTKELLSKSKLNL